MSSVLERWITNPGISRSKPLGGSKGEVVSSFRVRSKMYQELLRLALCRGLPALRQLNPIHIKGL